MQGDTLSEEQRAALERLVEIQGRGSYYQLLGVPTEATAKELQDAYYELSRAWHPDRFFRLDLGDDADRIESLFVSITSAYKVLSDATTRKSYDRDELPRYRSRRGQRQASRSRSSRSASDSRQTPPPRADPTPPRSGESSVSSLEDPIVHEATLGERKRPRSQRARIQDRERSKRRRSNATRRTSDESTSSSRTERRPLRAAGSSRRTRRSANVERLKEEMRQKTKRARGYFEQGKAEVDAGKIVKAASSLYLATTYDPRSKEYKALFDEVSKEARKLKAAQFVAAAEGAESYQRAKEAIAHYRSAVEYDPTNGRALHRLALLVRRYEEDDRQAVQLLRQAVNSAPNVIEYRMALADLYAELGMSLNARREYQQVLEQDKGNAEARAALRRVR